MKQDEMSELDFKPVTCLGMTFKNDEERRAYFTEELRKKLQDPEFRKIEGFPIGNDEDILALSDPPYYTACPNPWIADFINDQRPETRDTEPCHREPFAADVSEGKNDPIYNAHSYHTKVPHKAIMRYILHYTEPGDVVFDGFCGTGMTGVAAQLCGDREVVMSLGYKVNMDGTILQEETDEDGKTVWRPFSKLGARRAILNDLSPAATFIAYNYNTPVDVAAFEKEAKRILKEVETECGWMYRTLHWESSRTDQRGLCDEWAEKLKACKTVEEVRTLLSPQSLVLSTDPMWGHINYTVWSDVFVCQECTNEVVFWEAAVDQEAGKVHDEFPCPHCGATLSKRTMDRAWVTRFDKAIGKTIRQARQVPVLINYSVGKQRYEKTPDAFDLALIETIEALDIPHWFPTNRMPEGYNTEQPKVSHGLTNVHHFYTKRNLWVLGGFWTLTRESSLLSKMVWVCTGIDTICSKLLNFRVAGSGKPTPLKGTLYTSSLYPELNVLNMFYNKAVLRLKPIVDSLFGLPITETRSADRLDGYADLSFDYIFTDPPFGGNLMYSELNFLWEAWLRVFTNNKPEAIENKVQGKGLADYQRLMTECFREYYRVLKPGRWMTVEFHNSKNAVWNVILEALQVAGFVIADVRTLDKQQGSFKQVTSANTVKQDLVISCYKPNGGLEERFQREAGTEEGVWDFVRTHLKQLPVFVSKDGKEEIIAERQNYLLFDRMVAFHVQRGVMVPLSAGEFYAGLAQRFSERDGMYFTPDQVAEYDRKRMSVREVLQLQLFVMDEASAIQWLKQQLLKKPQTFQELHPQFLREISGWQKHEKPLELSELLEQNFLRYDGKEPIPAQIVSWLKQSEEMRKIILEGLAAGHLHEENGALHFSSQNPQTSALITRSKDRWYVPDPNRAGDLEKLREKALLKEFEEYKETKKKLKVFRLEAVRAGFKKAWQERDYAVIVAVADKIPNNILEEDPKLLMWYDQAITRMEGE